VFFVNFWWDQYHMRNRSSSLFKRVLSCWCTLSRCYQFSYLPFHLNSKVQTSISQLCTPNLSRFLQQWKLLLSILGSWLIWVWCNQKLQKVPFKICNSFGSFWTLHQRVIDLHHWFYPVKIWVVKDIFSTEINLFAMKYSLKIYKICIWV